MMARKPAPWLVPLGVAVASWAAAVSVVQAVLGVDIAASARQIEDRIELRLKGGEPAYPDPRQPAHSHGVDGAPIEPWELVSV
jgi:hypothetical protein